MTYNPKDFYFKKAKSQNYVARSVFKLEEIDTRFQIFKPAYQVLDLGAAPGSWSQYAAQSVAPQGKVLGIDLQPIHLTLQNVLFIVADLRDLKLGEIMEKEGFNPPFDVVLSDMAPKTTGIRITDQTRSLELCEIALQAADQFLRPKGHFICKLFHGEEFGSFRQKLKDRFEKVEAIRPKSTRKESKEIFFVAIRKKKD